jgi:hypothetical protein
MTHSEPLGDATAHRGAVHIGTLDTEVVQHRDHIVGKSLGAVGLVGLVAAAGPAVVESDGRAGGIKVLPHRVPPVVVVRLAGEQDQRIAVALAW